MARKSKAATLAYYRKYRCTPRGMLNVLHSSMVRRVRGGSNRPHLYTGKSVLPSAAFFKWALAQTDFHRLYAAWKKSKFDTRLKPSVDRIDSSKGYTISNMRWVTASQNKAMGASGPKTPAPIKQAIYKVAGVKSA